MTKWNQKSICKFCFKLSYKWFEWDFPHCQRWIGNVYVSYVRRSQISYVHWQWGQPYAYRSHLLSSGVAGLEERTNEMKKSILKVWFVSDFQYVKVRKIYEKSKNCKMEKKNDFKFLVEWRDNVIWTELHKLCDLFCCSPFPYLTFFLSRSKKGRRTT